MALDLNARGEIYIDHASTGLLLRQTAAGTVIVSRDGTTHQMPHPRYSAAADAPLSGVSGRVQLEADLRALLRDLDSKQMPALRVRVLDRR